MNWERFLASKQKLSHWNNVVADYPDVFAEPGMPAERETKHKIELLPGAMPQYRR